MFFSRSSLGMNPVPYRAPNSGPVTATTGLTTPKDVCTADGKLMYVNGAWRVRSLESDACISTATIHSYEVAKSKVPIFVGPFRIDPSNSAGQISTFNNPVQVGADWGNWLYNAELSLHQARVKAGHPEWGTHIPLLSLLPRVVGATQDYEDDGTPHGRVVTVFKNADGSSRAAVPFAPIPPDTASGGHALHPNQAWFDNDANGNRIVRVTYDGDSNTYSYYNFAQWLHALSPSFLDGLGARLFSAYLKSSNTTEFNKDADVPPTARFTYPAFDNAAQEASYAFLQPQWGLWVSIVPAAGRTSSTVPAEGDWDTGLDAPSGYVMQVGMAPMPHEGFWDQIMDAILWIPTFLGEALWDLSQWLGEATCLLSQQTQMVKNLPKDPATQAGALAALAVFNAACPSPPPINCTATPNAPSCASIKSAVTPWWQRWYVIVPALGAVGYGIFKVLDKSHARAANP